MGADRTYKVEFSVANGMVFYGLELVSLAQAHNKNEPVSFGPGTKFTDSTLAGLARPFMDERSFARFKGDVSSYLYKEIKDGVIDTNQEIKALENVLADVEYAAVRGFLDNNSDPSSWINAPDSLYHYLALLFSNKSMKDKVIGSLDLEMLKRPDVIERLLKVADLPSKNWDFLRNFLTNLYNGGTKRTKMDVAEVLVALAVNFPDKFTWNLFKDFCLGKKDKYHSEIVDMNDPELKVLRDHMFGPDGMNVVENFYEKERVGFYNAIEIFLKHGHPLALQVMQDIFLGNEESPYVDIYMKNWAGKLMPWDKRPDNIVTLPKMVDNMALGTYEMTPDVDPSYQMEFEIFLQSFPKMVRDAFYRDDIISGSIVAHFSPNETAAVEKEFAWLKPPPSLMEQAMNTVGLTGEKPNGERWKDLTFYKLVELWKREMKFFGGYTPPTFKGYIKFLLAIDDKIPQNNASGRCVNHSIAQRIREMRFQLHRGFPDIIDRFKDVANSGTEFAPIGFLLLSHLVIPVMARDKEEKMDWKTSVIMRFLEPQMDYIWDYYFKMLNGFDRKSEVIDILANGIDPVKFAEGVKKASCRLTDQSIWDSKLDYMVLMGHDLGTIIDVNAVLLLMAFVMNENGSLPSLYNALLELSKVEKWRNESPLKNIVGLLRIFVELGQYSDMPVTPLRRLTEMMLTDHPAGKFAFEGIKTDVEKYGDDLFLYQNYINALLEVAQNTNSLTIGAAKYLLGRLKETPDSSFQYQLLHDELVKMDLSAIVALAGKDKDALNVLKEFAYIGNPNAVPALLEIFRRGVSGSYEVIKSLIDDVDGFTDQAQVDELISGLVSIAMDKGEKAAEKAGDLVISAADVDRSGAWRALSELAVNELYKLDEMNPRFVDKLLTGESSENFEELDSARGAYDSALAAAIGEVENDPVRHELETQFIEDAVKLGNLKYNEAVKKYRELDEQIGEFIDTRLDRKEMVLEKEYPEMLQNIELLQSRFGLKRAAMALQVFKDMQRVQFNKSGKKSDDENSDVAGSDPMSGDSTIVGGRTFLGASGKGNNYYDTYRSILTNEQYSPDEKEQYIRELLKSAWFDPQAMEAASMLTLDPEVKAEYVEMIISRMVKDSTKNSFAEAELQSLIMACRDMVLNPAFGNSNDSLFAFTVLKIIIEKANEYDVPSSIVDELNKAIEMIRESNDPLTSQFGNVLAGQNDPV